MIACERDGMYTYYPGKFGGFWYIPMGFEDTRWLGRNSDGPLQTAYIDINVRKQVDCVRHLNAMINIPI